MPGLYNKLTPAPVQADAIKAQLAAKGFAMQPGAVLPVEPEGRQLAIHWRGLASMIEADQEDFKALADSRARYLALALDNYHRCAQCVHGGIVSGSRC